MQTGIHPELRVAQITCTSCNTMFMTHSSVGDVNVEICSQCHPAYTGRVAQSTGGTRIERFERRLERSLTA